MFDSKKDQSYVEESVLNTLSFWCEKASNIPCRSAFSTPASVFFRVRSCVRGVSNVVFLLEVTSFSNARAYFLFAQTAVCI